VKKEKEKNIYPGQKGERGEIHGILLVWVGTEVEVWETSKWNKGVFGKGDLMFWVEKEEKERRERPLLECLEGRVKWRETHTCGEGNMVAAKWSTGGRGEKERGFQKEREVRRDHLRCFRREERLGKEGALLG